MPSTFHFLEPLWLLALIPLALILWQTTFSHSKSQAWAKVIDPNLLPLLLQGEDKHTGMLAKWLLGIGWLITVLALADPSWEKIPKPIFQTNSARVIVLDLSSSMAINDLKPSRLARARFKIEDILSRKEEGQTGLVVFAGDAFTASPLTRDTDTIRSLLQIFTPSIMPVQGSRVDYGLKKAHELLKQAGVKNGQVLLVADGVSNQNAAKKAADELTADGHSVSVLGVGTEKGGLLRLRTKRINIKLEAQALQDIARHGGGSYHLITTSNADLQAVLKTPQNIKKQQVKTDDLKSEDWKSTGPFLILLLLPLAALAFRKGWLLNILFAIGLVGLLGQPQPALANSLTDGIDKQWQKFWFNTEQRADKALKQEHFEDASKLSKNPFRKGSAEYKNNNYKEALKSFKKAKGADARYNEGNALAKLKKYQEAIKAYDKALTLQPDMSDAKANKKAVEALLKKQQQQKKKQSDKQEKSNKKQKNNKDKKGQKKRNKGDKQQQKNNKSGQKKSSDKKQGKKGGEKEGKKENQFAKANKQMKNADKQEKNATEEQSEKEKKAEKNANKKNQEINKRSQKEDAKKAKKEGTKAKAEELNKEEKMAAEQWLRRIPDDPGGLLRRKFRRQYQRSNRRQNDDEQPW